MPKTRLSKNAMMILGQRYLKKNKSGKVIEGPDAMFRRVARNIALADAKYAYPAQVRKLMKKHKCDFWQLADKKDFHNLIRNNADIKRAERQFYNIMASLDFLPNSPTLLNAGRKLQQLAACFVLPIDDHIDSIFRSLHYAALIHKTGAGTGFNFSRLRPKGDVIGETGFTSGAVSFMKIFDAATEQIKLGGTLRGANMGILDVVHPDIEDFITIKSKENVLTNFNVSVALTDKFMELARKDKDYGLVNPRTGRTIRKESARRIFDTISEQAWLNGDPGVIFIDRMNQFNPLPELGSLDSTDSCGEQPLLPYESCNLGSLNLSNFVDKGSINYSKLRSAVQVAVHFLDNVIDMCNYPLKETKKIVEKNRKIGLGVMGFAECLVKMGIAYDSQEGIQAAEGIMKFISEEAGRASAELAKERGAFPNWRKSIYRKIGVRLRNATRTTLAPTGTISIIADTSSGIEPLFALSYARKTAEGNVLYYFNEQLKAALIERGIFNEEIKSKITRYGSVQHIGEIPEDIKKTFVVANDISPEYHVKMQAAFQKYVDNGISKTVTLPYDATVDDIKRIFSLAHELGCKGISVYRSGSREGQVIYLSSKRDEQITLKEWVRR
ncbi:adenosylcobalamin-dependent ribonucleoside-diphosphate reductase [Candidatus Woesearchaeota archaeon]|nr:adenosylcobalamin-dependent ribonucleoside-diphosphate reductase [Candidatus Woesearchaeota archaeon]